MTKAKWLNLGRKTLISAAMITVGLGGTLSASPAQKPANAAQDRNYRIVGELSDEDLMAIWPPARRHMVSVSVPSGRKFYRAYRSTGKIPLADWLPDESRSGLRSRLRDDESRVKLLRGAKDRDNDGVPDNQDGAPWDRNRW